MRVKHLAVGAVAVAGLFGAASASADQYIRYTVTGTLSTTGGDSEGLNGARLTAGMLFDGTSVYGTNFGFAMTVAVSGSPFVTISGSSNGANNTTTPFTTDLAFYPTFAGTFTHPAGGHTEFFSGSGALFQFQMNTTPTAGSADAFVGTPVELDDFVPASWGGGSLINLGTGEAYSFVDVSITASKVPAPAALAAFGLAGLAGRRRRRAA
jgi:MYXO-CTERM domain-containing protein